MTDPITNPGSPSPLPAQEPRGIVLDIKHIVLAAAFLGVGGVGGGVISFSGAHVDTESLATKESVATIDKKLDDIKAQITAASLMAAKEDAANDAFKATTAQTLTDLEQRMRVLERKNR